MANPIQQGLKHSGQARQNPVLLHAAMANPIQQGLKQQWQAAIDDKNKPPQWLIQYNKD